MGTEIKYNKDVRGQLRATKVGKIEAPRTFPDWDILKEIDRRAARLSYNRGIVSVRKWMREHPEEVAKVEDANKAELDGIARRAMKGRGVE